MRRDMTPAEIVYFIMERSQSAPNGCRLWTEGKDSNGYGCITINRRKTRVHRALYEAVRGLIPKSLELRHTCDTPACVSLDHLVIGTHAENMADMIKRNRHRWGPRPKGTYVNTAKLTEAQVRAIRADSRSSWAVAPEYGVSRSAIRMIRLGRTWGWLP